MEDRQKPEAAGTLLSAIRPLLRETTSSRRQDSGGGGVQRAGARASQAEIGLVRRQQRHQPYPEYSPENHVSPRFQREEHGAAAASERLPVFLKLKVTGHLRIAKEMRGTRISFASIQKRDAFDALVIKIFRKCRMMRNAHGGIAACLIGVAMVSGC